MTAYRQILLSALAIAIGLAAIGEAKAAGSNAWSQTRLPVVELVPLNTYSPSQVISPTRIIPSLSTREKRK